MTIAASRLMAQAFIKALTGGEETPLRFRLIHDKDRSQEAIEFVDTISHAWEFLLARQRDGYGVFYFLNQVGPCEGYATDKDVIQVRAIPADFDEGLPDVWHSVPDLIVHTSEGRGQALWLSPWCSLEEFKPACKRVISLYNSDVAVQNLSRILRLPGTLHLKGEAIRVEFDKS